MSINLNAQATSYNASLLINNSSRSVKKEEILQTESDNTSTESAFTEAIRLYKGFTLTGVRELTNEEKKEIKGCIEEYMEKTNFLEKYNRNTVTRKDYAALNDYIKGLYKQFGGKDDYYEFITDFVDGMLEEAKNPDNPPRPPFKVIVPPEHALEMENNQKKPMLAAFQSPSPHQFLMAGNSGGNDNKESDKTN